MRNKRVIFTFDQRSLEALEQMTKRGRYDSYSDTIREALIISRALQKQQEEGFTEIVVRDPKKGKERVLVAPTLRLLEE